MLQAPKYWPLWTGISGTVGPEWRKCATRGTKQVTLVSLHTLNLHRKTSILSQRKLEKLSKAVRLYIVFRKSGHLGHPGM